MSECFKRGYEPFRDKLGDNNYYSRSCFNCAFYGVESPDAVEGSAGNKKEECQNVDVTSYDVIVDGNRVYCTQWQPLSRTGDFFGKRKSGRDLI